MATMDQIDYKIYGDDMQFVEVELDPNEATVAEAGGMMYMHDGIEMDTIFGDGGQQNQGFLAALVGAGKRVLTILRDELDNAMALCGCPNVRSITRDLIL